MSDPHPTRQIRPALFDPLRLLFGTLTIVPVKPPRMVNSVVAGRAMTLAPVAGLVLAIVLAIPVELLWQGSHGSALLLAALSVGSLAVLTRAMHLDGLADVADGLGSGRHGEEALAIMKRSDIGPFGVATLMLALLLQVAALADLIASGRGFEALLLALIASRTVLAELCGPDFSPARLDGLGAMVGRSVSGRQRWFGVGLALVLVFAATGLFDLAGWVDPTRVTVLIVAALGGLACGLGLALRAVHRFGGTTGDVYGAAVETTFTATLVLGALIG